MEGGLEEKEIYLGMCRSPPTPQAASQIPSPSSVLVWDWHPGEEALTGWGQKVLGEDGPALAGWLLDEEGSQNLSSTSAVWSLFLPQRTGSSSSCRTWCRGSSPSAWAETLPTPANVGDETGFLCVCRHAREIQSRTPQTSQPPKPLRSPSNLLCLDFSIYFCKVELSLNKKNMRALSGKLKELEHRGLADTDPSNCPTSWGKQARDCDLFFTFC